MRLTRRVASAEQGRADVATPRPRAAPGPATEGGASCSSSPSSGPSLVYMWRWICGAGPAASHLCLRRASRL